MARYYGSYLQYLSPPPVQLCFFIMVVLLLLGFSWYINYESMWEDLMDQVKLFLMISPVLLVLVVHWLSSSADRRLLIPLPEQETIHRVGGSPWGVALLLIFLIYMISYHSRQRPPPVDFQGLRPFPRKDGCRRDTMDGDEVFNDFNMQQPDLVKPLTTGTLDYRGKIVIGQERCKVEAKALLEEYRKACFMGVDGMQVHKTQCTHTSRQKPPISHVKLNVDAVVLIALAQGLWVEIILGRF
ncbi:hypothetical protein Cgig2_015837 [Carnegiea gigantea]|uniref:Uncharacterized protein n=1 Tax=Carnegiea gigantea TaxID=171969 RepID=A0A9Q1QJ24_9CARY|nr:hypothetical protein Cgig2_015837 [Carnegiea gigantea]